MARLEMKAADLGELYILLRLYQNTYGGIPGGLLEEIAYRYKTVSTVCSRNKTGGDICITNPRGAGRRSHVKEEDKKRILQLRREEKTMREIASETGYSVGYVHKLIHEHKDA